MARKAKTNEKLNGVAAVVEEDEQTVEDGLEIKRTTLNVSAPNFGLLQVLITGTTIYCQHKFGAKAIQQIIDQQMAGTVAKAKKEREPKDFDDLYHQAMHISREGWHGIPSPCFRNAMIDACRTVGVVMTRAKLAVTVKADGFDNVTDEPLTRIIKGKPYKLVLPVRNHTGVVDVRARPAWAPGWQALVQIRYDADMISASDVINLMTRVGAQVGIGEGRPSSKKSNGLGWGLFDVELAPEESEEIDD